MFSSFLQSRTIWI